MYVSVNDRNEIKMVGVSADPSLTSLFINDDMNPFKGWSEAKICCYKVIVKDGIVMMMTPYVDSRLLDHFDQLGLHSEENAEGLTDTQMALTENYEGFLEYSEVTDEAIEISNTQITDLEMAVVELYEMITDVSSLMEG